MLETTIDDTAVDRGDDLAGFSYRKSATEGHRVEAYSWGRLARYTGLPGAGRMADTVVRVLWLFLAPFGMTNAAYWARHRFGAGRAGEPVNAAGPTSIEDLVGRRGASGMLRLLGFLLTLLFLCVTSVLVFEIIPESRREILGFSVNAIPVGVLAIVPLLNVAIIGLLPNMGRTRYLPGLGTSPAPSAPGDGKPSTGPVPLLAHVRFWRVGAGIGHLSLLHFSGALAGVGLILCADLFHETTQHLGLSSAADPVLFSDFLLWLAVILSIGLACLLLMTAWHVYRSNVREAGEKIRTLHRVIFWLSLLLCLGSVIWAANRDADVAQTSSHAVVLVSIAIFLVLLGVFVQCVVLPGVNRSLVGWWGFGPLVFGLLAVGFSIMLSLAVVKVAALALDVDAAGLDPNRYGLGFFVIFSGLLLLLLVGYWQHVLRGRRRAPYAELIAQQFAERGVIWGSASDRMAAARKIEKSRHLGSMWRKAEFFAGVLAGLVALALCWAVVSGTVWLVTGKLIFDFPFLGAIANYGVWMAVVAVLALVVLSSAQEPRPVALLWDLMCFLPTQAHPFGPPCYTERSAQELADRVWLWLNPEDEASHAGTQQATEPQRNERRVILATHSMGLIVALATIFQLQARGLPEQDLRRIGLVSYGVQVRRYFARFFPQVFGPEVLGIVPAPGPRVRGMNPWPLDVSGEIAAETRQEAIDPPAQESALGAILGHRWINLYRPNDPLGFPIRYRFPATQKPSAAEPMDFPAEEYHPESYLFTAAAHRFYLPTNAYDVAIAAMSKRLEEPSG